MLDISFNIDRSSRTGPVLTVTSVEPSGYSGEIMDLRPQALFVFTRNNLNEPSANPFVRVATLNDLYTLPYNLSGVKGGEYRSDTFSKQYSSLPGMLKDYTMLQDEIRVYANNLKVMDSVAVVTGSTRYLYPDYENAVLKGLISDLKTARYNLESLTQEKAIIQITILPMLRTQVIQYTALKTAADSLYSKSENHALFLGDVVALQPRILDLKNTLLTFSRGNSLNKIRNLNAVDKFSRLRVLAGNLSGTGDDEDIKNSILSEIAAASAEIDPSSDTETLVSDSDTEESLRIMLPGINRIERIEADKYIGTESILTVVQSITEFGRNLDNAILSKEQRVIEIDLLQNEVRGKMQSLEAEISRIRPGIDIANPDSDWNLTIQLK